MKSILVPTDFSGVSDKACEYALKIAERAKAEIHFLHIQFTPVDWVKLEKGKEKNYPETLHQIGHAKNELSKWEKRAEDMGLQVKTLIVYDAGRSEIVKRTQNHRHDLVVMGSRGASGARETFLGSTAQKIIRHASAPVLVIKEKAPQFPMQNIVFASNFEDDFIPPFRTVAGFARLMGSHIHLLYVNTPYNFEETAKSEEKMKTFLKQCEDRCSTNIYNAFNEEQGIRLFADQKSADLIAITTHGKKDFLSMVSKSITESLVNHSTTSILSIRHTVEQTDLSKISKQHLPERHLACIDHTGPYQQNPGLFEKLFTRVVEWLQSKDLMHDPKMEAISIYHDDPDKVPESEQRISVGFTVPENTRGEGDIRIQSIPEGTYVVGSFEILPEAYGEAWSKVFQYIGEHHLKPGSGPMYESYKNDPTQHPEGKHLVDIAVKVQDE